MSTDPTITLIQQAQVAPGDTLVLSVGSILNEDQRNQLKAVLSDKFALGVKVLVLECGTTISHVKHMDEGQATRIEQKLDLLIECLAQEEEQEDQPSLSLDGSEAGGERDQSQPL